MKYLNSLLELAGKGNNNGKIFAILNTAIDRSLHEKIIKAKAPSVCLFQQAVQNQIEHVSPYMMEFDPGDFFLKWMVEYGFGRSWGIFLTSKHGIETMAAHYQQLVVAFTPEGKALAFRYYDPRILSVYFPVCNFKEQNYFLGPAENAIAEFPEEGKWSVFVRETQDVCFGI